MGTYADSIRRKLVAEIEDVARLTGRSPEAVGRDAGGAGIFYRQMKNNEGLTLHRYERAMERLDLMRQEQKARQIANGAAA